jgi:hypothetical protein
MTEAEWLFSEDPCAMLRVVRGLNPTERKVRLFNVAICQRFWNQLPEESREILRESELLADGLVDVKSEELCWRANSAVAPFDREFHQKAFPTREVRVQKDAAAAVCYAVLPGELFGAAAYFWDLDPSEKLAHAKIIRDLFGNPFHSVILDRARLDSQNRKPAEVAWNIYEDRRFEMLPTLATALADAGCSQREILDHCHSEGPHTRGCWVLDLVLGRQ